MMDDENSWVVIPCYNEAERLDVEAIVALIEVGIHVLLVNDGSTDGTWSTLLEIKTAHPQSVTTIGLMQNVGKAESVRRGLLAALDKGATDVGYLDADFATSAAEYLRLRAALLGTKGHEVVLGSRWMHMGADIQRTFLRHLVGRVFATLASNILGMGVYDTQCGAKVLRRSHWLSAALAAPFISRWAFDVELLGRLHFMPDGMPVERIVEVPLGAWAERTGSRIGYRDALKLPLDLWRIHRSLRTLAGAVKQAEVGSPGD
jgi:glycosyltransferase involved in cell wall biosynthesis